MAAKSKPKTVMAPPKGRTPVAAVYDQRKNHILVVCDDRTVWTMDNHGAWVPMAEVPA